jgi:hypothetical protein
MTDLSEIDLFLQDFLSTNRLQGENYNWGRLVHRQYAEEPYTKVFSFTSGDSLHYAVGTYKKLPDMDWFCISFSKEVLPISEYRLDCLRMVSQNTHTEIRTEKVEPDILLIKLTTKHRGLVNIVFLLHPPHKIQSPFMLDA